ncbi:hypothetical protein AMELA_G00056740 [Ameiurus melas]|uniref:BAR domain-containing protein n=1 Tax=Ameiurus melas TaxID=219545 RepID=A0A7J6B3A5_AMEME|nr:hypothetical protein AMELA_G00056740 [Ameiurus melas]
MMCRAAVEDVEGDVGELESKLDKLVKLSIGMIDAGRVYSHANRQFINGIRDLALQSSRDDVIGVRTTVQHTYTAPPGVSFLVETRVSVY